MVTKPLLSEPGSSPVTKDAGINLKWSYPTEVSAVRGNQGGIAGERKTSLVPERDEFFVPADWVEKICVLNPDGTKFQTRGGYV